MFFYKKIQNNIINAIGTHSNVIPDNCIEITQEEYNSILEIIQNKPEDTDTQIYKLHADTMTYIAEDRPQKEETQTITNDYGIPDELYEQIKQDILKEQEG